MNLLSWIIIGGLAGWLANRLLGTHRRMGCLGNIFAGIIGGVLGGWITSSLFGVSINGFTFQSFVIALLGAILFIGIINIFRK